MLMRMSWVDDKNQFCRSSQAFKMNEDSSFPYLTKLNNITIVHVLLNI